MIVNVQIMFEAESGEAAQAEIDRWGIPEGAVVNASTTEQIIEQPVVETPSEPPE